MKKIAAFLLALCMALSFFPLSAAAEDAIQVTVNGKAVHFPDAKPFLDENNRTLVPLRAVAEAMGLTVSWDEKTQRATFSKEWTLETAMNGQDYDGDGAAESYTSKAVVSFGIAEAFYRDEIAAGYFYNKRTDQIEFWESEEPSVTEMDTAAVLKDSRTYAPIRYLAEPFFYDVFWDGATKTVKLEPSLPFDCVTTFYRYSDGLHFLIDNQLNTASAQIDAVSISRDGDKAVPLGYYTYTREEMLGDYYDYFEKLLNFFLSKDGSLDAIHVGADVDYYFDAGHTYDIRVDFSGLKTNGAPFNMFVRCHYDLTE